MRILLVGEYSRLHNSLKEGLMSHGHEVTIISTGDNFKNYPSDIKLKIAYQGGLMKWIRLFLFKFFGMDMTSNSVARQFFDHAKQLKGYDVVQLINESPFGLIPSKEKQLIAFLEKHNKKLFLLCCGTDYLSVKYALSDILPYSILHDYKNGKIDREAFNFILKYTKPEFKGLHEYVYERINGVIASDIDYHMPLEHNPAYLGLIPNPVNIDKLQYRSLPINGKINIFMGINRANYHTKGIIYFEEAMKIILKKYDDRILFIKAENLPYSEYIEKYNDAHILLDQALGFDQGYNALEAMAKGKVVFTGAEKIFEEYYQLTETVAINATPDAEKIAADLTALIEDPQLINAIGSNARKFIEDQHHYKKVARRYVDVWNAN